VLTTVSLMGGPDKSRGFYHWGTLHLLPVYAALELAGKLGFFPHPWRQAYYDILGGDFERVYVVGRLVSVLMGLLGLLAVYLIGLEIGDARAGVLAALLVAVSPVHLLASTQIRVDLTMAALTTLAVWLGLRASADSRPRVWFWLGLASGGAIVAKYTALVIALPVVMTAAWPRRHSRRAIGSLAAGLLIGILAGVILWIDVLGDIARQVREALRAAGAAPESFRISPVELLRRHGVDWVRFGVGPVAVLPALWGLWEMGRRRTHSDRILLAWVAGGLATLIAMRWPLLRYQAPLIPAMAIASAVALGRLRSRWRWPATFATILFPLAASLAQVRFMRSEHPANLMLPVVLETVPAGAPIARLAAEIPPLDTKVYPMGPNPFLDDITRDPPAWVLTLDLPDQPYPAASQRLLKTRYERVAGFRLEPSVAWATFGEAGAPHDWKYTHPAVVLYRRR